MSHTYKFIDYVGVHKIKNINIIIYLELNKYQRNKVDTYRITNNSLQMWSLLSKVQKYHIYQSNKVSTKIENVFTEAKDYLSQNCYDRKMCILYINCYCV